MSLADEAVDDRVIERTALGRARIAIEGIDGIETQDASGIDRIGITAQTADFAEGIGFRLQLGRRNRGGTLRRRLRVAFVE